MIQERFLTNKSIPAVSVVLAAESDLRMPHYARVKSSKSRAWPCLAQSAIDVSVDQKTFLNRFSYLDQQAAVMPKYVLKKTRSRVGREPST